MVEQNVSGSKPWRERALGDAVDACEHGDAAGIVVAWQDRLSRENGRATAEVWEALEKAGARLVCAAEGLDTATGDHEMLFTIKAAIAREQWKRHRANWDRAKRSATERGVPSGRAPIGYKKRRGGSLEVAPREAAKVREAFELRARGVPFAQIGAKFGWSHSTARQILANEVYLGVLEHGGIRNESAHPAIVPRDLFDAVQAARTVREPAPGALTADRLLQGLARCHGCGRTLKVVHRQRADGSCVSAYFCKDAAGESCPERASDAALVAGDEQSRRAARDELRRQQRLRAARRNDWPELPRGELVFGDFYVEHEPTGDLYLRMLGEVSEGHRDGVDAYTIGDDTWPIFLERPRSGPKTRAQLEERQKK